MQRAAETLEISDRLQDPALAATASQLFYWAATDNDPLGFLGRALPLIAQSMESEYLALVQGSRGRWKTIAASGPERSPPNELMSESLDSGQPVARSDWYI